MWLHFLQKIQTFAPLCCIVLEDKNNACISIAICLFIRALFGLAHTFSWNKKWKKGMKIIKSRAARLPFKVALTRMHTMRNINGREVSLSIKYSTCSDFFYFLDTVWMLKVDFCIFWTKSAWCFPHRNVIYVHIIYLHVWNILLS